MRNILIKPPHIRTGISHDHHRHRPPRPLRLIPDGNRPNRRPSRCCRHRSRRRPDRPLSRSSPPCSSNSKAGDTTTPSHTSNSTKERKSTPSSPRQRPETRRTVTSSRSGSPLRQQSKMHRLAPHPLNPSEKTKCSSPPSPHLTPTPSPPTSSETARSSTSPQKPSTHTTPPKE